MDESVKSDEESLVLRELKKMSKVLLLANAAVIEKELTKIASSDVRKKMWIFTDGKRMPKDIATEAGVTQMAVSYFLTAMATAEFIEYNKGEPPRRILDYVPPAWIDLIMQGKTAQTPDAEGKEDAAKQDTTIQSKEEVKT
jgi:hypothetical protein